MLHFNHVEGTMEPLSSSFPFQLPARVSNPIDPRAGNDVYPNPKQRV
jgi:hypothetical protein